MACVCCCVTLIILIYILLITYKPEIVARSNSFMNKTRRRINVVVVDFLCTLTNLIRHIYIYIYTSVNIKLHWMKYAIWTAIVILSWLVSMCKFIADTYCLRIPESYCKILWHTVRTQTYLVLCLFCWNWLSQCRFCIYQHNNKTVVTNSVNGGRGLSLSTPFSLYMCI